MSLAYLDCFSGVAGDMWVGALLDLGLELEELREVVAGMPLPGVQLRAEEVLRAGLRGTRFVVEVDPATAGHAHRHLRDIAAILSGSALPEPVRERSLQVFQTIAAAEAEVHGSTVDAVHFHEVGAEDTIVDVACAVYGCYRLGIDEVYSSAVVTGQGTVDCAHGTMPVPAPGALGALLGVPLRSGGPPFECVTPTGAALLKVLCTGYQPELDWVVHKVGYGAGTRDPKGHANLLRISLGARRAPATAPTRVLEMSCNLDTATGEELGHLLQQALERGALDAWCTPIQMKKGRPGQVLTLLCDPAHQEALAGFLLEESGSLGLRVAELRRTVLERWEELRETPLGRVRFKCARLPSGRELARPEADELERLVRETGRSRRQILADLA